MIGDTGAVFQLRNQGERSQNFFLEPNFFSFKLKIGYRNLYVLYVLLMHVYFKSADPSSSAGPFLD